LQLRAISFSLADLQEFVADVWPLAEDAADIVFWAKEFASGHGNMTA
jgi:hypothetical protein